MARLCSYCIIYNEKKKYKYLFILPRLKLALAIAEFKTICLNSTNYPTVYSGHRRT